MKYSILILISAFMFSACSTKYVLDSDKIEKYRLSADDLQGIQFYNSHDIVLTKYEAKTADKTTDGGTLNLNYGKEIDQLMIKEGTRGKVVKQLDGNRLAISFEPDDSKFLVFGAKEGGTTYYLQALEWNGDRGKIKYGPEQYLTNAGADRTSLTFKLKRKYIENKEFRVAKGNKL
ncbi:MAG: hypothetical protein HN728_04295 [Flavobacteriales bacterium]|jgi:hypothetical protein|nr:hypothetical protein [Flavobacteriales bacterium]MBT4706063.1 hypothetical protein [Flavobacteriales bacterium]MBT5133370.1 hypothetical protein [Flavobacteriales bacterium]MBT6133435.1 hypothetical protein [Flavobacteriales bacterium]MBT6381866.1 hypothetical protein [Flavobacteriales bacterium]